MCILCGNALAYINRYKKRNMHVFIVRPGHISPKFLTYGKK